MIQAMATDNWITFLFVILIAILVVLNYIFPTKFKDFKSFFKKEQFYTKYFTTFKISDLFFLFFSFFAILVYSFILFKLKLYYQKDIKSSNFLLFIKIVGISFWFVVLIIFIGKMLVKILRKFHLFDSFLFYKWLFLSKNALFLLPIIIIFHYYNLMYAYVILGLITAIILIYNYFVLLYKNQKDIFKFLFYFILYLCTLEIAPLIIYFKIVLSVK